jgi:hypothetical protein
MTRVLAVVFPGCYKNNSGCPLTSLNATYNCSVTSGHFTCDQNGNVILLSLNVNYMAGTVRDVRLTDE